MKYKRLLVFLANYIYSISIQQRHLIFYQQNFSLVKIKCDDKLKVAKMAEVVPDRADNKKGNTDYQHFLLIPHFFQKFPFPGSLKPS